ncbi:MAG TPA: ROK family protein, partial [Ignavibacteria bacterium]|nr:ROK family protein [Ignavibacteria bacterium]
MSVIGIDLGGTKCAGAIFINNGKMIHKKIVPLQKRKGMEVGLLIQDHLRNLLNFANNENVGIESIGISVPGISYSKTGKVWAPNIPGWDAYPLLHEIQSNIKSIKIKIDSDRTCYILGEAWQGAAKGCKDAIFISVGTGIGAGILVNGEILRGSNDITGAIGWWGLDKPYQSEYKECGCFEYHASGEGLVKVANEFLSHDPSYNGILRGKTSDAINTRDIFNAYNQKDP